MVRTARAACVVVALWAATAVASPTAPGVALDRESIDLCPAQGDYETGAVIDQPILGCCAAVGSCSASLSPGNTLRRWTPERIIGREGAAVVIGESDWYSLDTAASIPHQTTSTCLHLQVDDGGSSTTAAKSGDNLVAYANNLIEMAAARGVARPLLFRSHRFESIYAVEMGVGTGQVEGNLTRDLIIRSDRSWATWLAWAAGGTATVAANACISGLSPCCVSHCRAGTTATKDCAFDYDTATTELVDDGCDDTDDANPEYAWTLATQLHSKRNVSDSAVEETALYSYFYRGAAAVRSPLAVVGDITNQTYLDWAVDYFHKTNVAEGSIWLGAEIPLKRHFFTTDGTSNVEHWPDIGDSLGGYLGANTGNAMTLTEISSYDDLYVGPPEILEGYGSCDSGDATYNAGGAVAGCRFTWPYYAYGMLKLSRTMRDHSPRIYGLVYAQPIDWSCASGTVLNAAGNYTSGNCRDYWDNADTATSECTGVGTPHPACTGNQTCDLNCNEAAMWREMQLNMGYMRIDLQGTAGDAVVTDAPPGSVAGGIGAGSGAGITLNTMLATIQATDRPPVWLKAVDSTNGYGTPPKVCLDNNEVNPGTPITPQAASPNVVVADLQLVCSAKTGTTYVAPAACYADVIDTTHTDGDVNTFGDLRVKIDWGDGDTSDYDYGPGIDRSISLDPVAGHVYTAAGSYTVTATVTDALGNTDSDTASVTVVAQDTGYTDANTRCVCNDGAGSTCQTSGVAGFSGCPIDNNADGDCLDGGEDSTLCIEQAAAETGIWNAAGKRTLFRKGDTFTLGSITPTSAASDGSMIGAYGSGARPELDLSSDIATLTANSGWKSVGIRYDGSGIAADGDSSPQVWGVQSSGSTGISDFLLYDNEIVGMGYGLQVSTAYTDAAWNERIGIFANTFEIKEAPSSGYYLVLFSARRGAIIGNSFTQNGGSSYNGLRFMGNDRVAVAHNLFDGQTAAVNMSLQFRSCADTIGAGCTRDDQYVVISGNDINDETPEGGWPIRLINSHDGVSQASVSAEKRSYIFRRNVYRAAGSKTALQTILSIDGVADYWIQDNVADLRGIPNLSGLTTRFAIFGSTSSGANGPGRIENNTVISSEGAASRSYVFCSASGVSLSGNNYCLSNLWWEENTSPSLTVSDGSWTLVSDNVYAEEAAQSPFYGTADNGTLSAFSSSWDELEARIRTGAVDGQPLVVNEGYPPSLDPTGAVLRDFRGFVRADSTPTVGAFEDGAVDDW